MEEGTALSKLNNAMAELCARLREHFETSGHPACPDPECDYDDGREHSANCAFIAYVTAQDEAIAMQSMNEQYEDELPVDITDAEYSAWFAKSRVIDGVRVGPKVAR